jgi:putative transposase
MLPGYTYHITQRCVNKEFLLRYQKDRNNYRKWLREGVQRHGVVLYGYCITSNHVHVIARVDSTESVSKMMQLAAGTTARAYNRRKGRSGAFWGEQYHCTVVEDGKHLWRCLRYVDLNMVRAGKVAHPRDWQWCGYHELMGMRKRYRLLSVNHLLEALGDLHRDDFRENYQTGIDNLHQNQHQNQFNKQLTLPLNFCIP